MDTLIQFYSTASPLVKAAIIDVTIQWALWSVAAFFQTEIFYDLAGSSTFLYLAWQTLKWGKSYHTRQVIQTLCVSAWSLRLGSYLFVRIINDKGVDKRFNRVRSSPFVFFVYWTIQALWIWITLAPTMILNSKRMQGQEEDLGMSDYAGWALWLAGFLLEVIADSQKSTFRANPDNHGKWVKTGLWGYSRHPNYLGEMMLWIGLFISASSVLRGKEWLSMISPVFVVFLLTRVSGIPLLEKQGDRRWGHMPEYQEYKKRVRCLIPYIW